MERLIQRVFNARLSAKWILYQKVYSSMYRYLIDMPETMGVLVKVSGEDDTFRVMERRLKEFHCGTYVEMKKTMVSIFDELTSGLSRVYSTSWDGSSCLNDSQRGVMRDWVDYLIQKGETETSRGVSGLLDCLGQVSLSMSDRLIGILNDMGFDSTWDLMYGMVRPLFEELQVYEDFKVEGSHWDQVILRYYVESNLDLIYFENTYGSYFD